MMNAGLIITVGKRLLTSIFLLFLLVSVIFFLLRIAPGDPANKYISPEFTPELSERIAEDFGLDKPLFEQYFTFLGNISKGQLGISYEYRRPVTEVLSEFIPFTLIFAVSSLAVQLLIACFAGLYIFRKKNALLQKSTSAFSLILYSAPTFIIGVFLILIFSEKLSLLPSSGLKSFNFNELSFFEKAADYVLHLILPVITLSAGGAALFYNYFKEKLDEISSDLFVMNLKANGIGWNEIIKEHLIPNAAGPLISAAAVEFGILLGGALITEVIFSLPGMGRLTIFAILTRDYPLVAGCTFFAGSMVIISNLLGDFIRGAIDKRLLAGGILN